MTERAGEEEDALDGQRDEKEIKVTVVSQPHTITHPGAMMIEPVRDKNVEFDGNTSFKV